MAEIQVLQGSTEVAVPEMAVVADTPLSKRGRGWHGDPEGHAAAGRKGGRTAHERGTAHRFTSEEAREAGRKGGRAAHQRGTAHEFNASEARRAGRRGAASRAQGE